MSIHFFKIVWNNFYGDIMIKELRNKKGYTQEQLADTLQISLRHYIRIENESIIPRADVFYNLINTLDMNNEQIGEFINCILNKKKG